PYSIGSAGSLSGGGLRGGIRDQTGFFRSGSYLLRGRAGPRCPRWFRPHALSHPNLDPIMCLLERQFRERPPPDHPVPLILAHPQLPAQLVEKAVLGGRGGSRGGLRI